MPPLRTGRASRACDLCRKYKTRCYESATSRGTCLRCETLSQPCSLESPTINRSPVSQLQPHNRHATVTQHQESTRDTSVNDRLDRLERAVGLLVDRIDSRPEDHVSKASHGRRSPPMEPESPPDLDPAPVFLIKDAATSAGVNSPEQTTAHPSIQPDVISSGLVPLSTAQSLIHLFHLHYGRWVRFPENVSPDTLLLSVRKSPMLLCSVFLIAVRHTTQELADRLAPKLFQESKRLVTTSLLEVPQAIEFFQACLILSLWSTTIGQEPLSIDSWLLTGYAIQQALASPHFAEILRHGSGFSSNRLALDSWFLWNHLCVAHLQYCVGTRRQALLNQAQIDRCVEFIRSNNATNYETRMGAEISLYWIIYNKCNGSHINLGETKQALHQWKTEWSSLFDEPRSQFLQIGFHFGHLLAYCQSLKSPKSVMYSSVLREMIRLSTTIINLAIDTADDRTRHLTDHIYHIVTFSALTLCRIVHTYEPKLHASKYDVEDIDHLVFKLINWFRSIGLPCHVAHLLGNIVSAQFHKFRPNFQPVAVPAASMDEGNGIIATTEDLFQPSDLSFYPSFIGSELFGIDAGIYDLPDWGPMHSDTDTSV